MKGIGKYLLRILLFISPALILVVSYLILDPFMVVYKHSPFYSEESMAGIITNAGYVSTMTYKENHLARKYNSFIFGSSRSGYYNVEDWQRYIGKNSCFHFNAHAETLYGVTKKIEYIDSIGGSLDNVLLIVDKELLEADYNRYGHLFTICPELEGGRNKFGFQVQFFQAFIKPEFFVACFDYLITGEVKDYMKNRMVISDEFFTYDSFANEAQNIRWEEEIEQGGYYTGQRMDIFAGVTILPNVSVIRPTNRDLLQRIADILAVHHTRFKVVVHPLYKQYPLHSDDLAILQEIFGPENVYDFSGDERFTTDYRLYYDANHLRPLGTRTILREMYH